MAERAFVVGVGMTKFEKPAGRDWDYPDMAREAGHAAPSDAGLWYSQIEQASVGFCQGETTCGQRALAELGLTGAPTSSTGPFNKQVFSVYGRSIGIFQGWSLHDEITADDWTVESIAEAAERFPRKVQVNTQLSQTVTQLGIG
jgi:hypothetical protein